VWVGDSSVGNGSGSGVAVPPPPPPPPPTSPPPPPIQNKKVARFITAEAAQSKIEPAEDGNLPELHLREGKKSETLEEGLSTVNPLVLLAAVSMSVVLSVVLVLADMQDETPSNDRSKEHARWDPDSAKPLKPYQVYLRQARQAYTRGDRKSERRLYRNVLDMLLSERDTFERGVTGSRSRDRRLKEQISILLCED
jgi:hypothetical protein